MSNKKTPGRPEGSKTQDLPTSEVVKSVCKSCGSTKREKYFGTPIEFDISGERNGRPYNKLIRKRTRCADCGQQRLDSFYEMVKPPKAKK